MERNVELPPEILDQIFGEFITEEPVRDIDSLGSLDQWQAFIASDRLTPVDRDHGGCGSLANIDLDIYHLLRLRLVSRRWNYSVSRLLQKNLWWNVKFDKVEHVKNIGECCDNATHHLSELVSKLCLPDLGDLIPFARIYSYESEKFEGQNVDNNYIILNSAYDVYMLSERGTARNRTVHSDKTKEHAILRNLFGRLSQSECFSVSFPEATTEEQDGFMDLYDMQGVDNMIGTLQYGLNCPAFQHLKDLSLLVPSTRHIGQLASSLSPEARDRLIHLRLVIQDESGPCGTLDKSSYDESPDGDNTVFFDTRHIPSNMQMAYPNREHQDALWEFVGSCRNLESLAISATHFLGQDRLKWDRAAGFRGLKHLSLRRVWTNVASILMLLSPFAGGLSTSVARRVNLDEVKIYGDGGNWATVFDFLRDRCPNVDFIRLYELTYFTNHTHYRRNTGPRENRKQTWTGSDEDRQSLRQLEDQINVCEGSSICFDMSSIGYDVDGGDGQD